MDGKKLINEIEKPIKKFRALKIISLVLYVLTTAFTLIFLLDVLGTEEGLGKGLGAALWIIFSAIALAVPVIVSLISAIVSAVYRKRGQCVKGSLLFFLIFTALPIVTFVLCLLILKLAI